MHFCRLPWVASLAVAFLLSVLAPNPALAQIPTHSYQLNGNYSDSNGGPDLTGNGGTFTATGLIFGPNQGPSLSNAIHATNYSIEMYFRLDSVSGWRKLVDFQNRTADSGLYNRDGSLYMFPASASPSNTFVPGQMAHLIITRDGTSNVFTGYVDGIARISFTDTRPSAAFNSANNIAHFLQDDATSGGRDVATGFLDFINIYDRPLTQAEVSSRFATVPEPGTVALTVSGLLPLAGVVVRRRRRQGKFCQ